MSKIDPNAPAFPPNAGWRDNEENARGMTIRAHFAAKALQGLLSSSGDVIDFDVVSHEAVKIADTTIAELNKEQDEKPSNNYERLLAAAKKLRDAEYLRESYHAAQSVGANTPGHLSASDMRAAVDEAQNELFEILAEIKETQEEKA